MDQENDRTEEALMTAYCGGDLKAFDGLFARLGPRLHGFFMRSFNSTALADDLMQTTLLKLHRARSEYRHGLPVRPWVFSIAARVRLDEIRKRRRLAEDFDEEALARMEDGHATGSHPAETAESGERVSAVRVALASLPESQRVIIHLHRLEGMTFPEIARVLGTTDAAVRQRAFRGYERLRKQLCPLLRAGSES
jgi:RNA polymerase sigma factor (sigma-70 family)